MLLPLQIIFLNGEQTKMQEADIRFPDVNYGESNKEAYHELTISEWSQNLN